MAETQATEKLKTPSIGKNPIIPGSPLESMNPQEGLDRTDGAPFDVLLDTFNSFNVLTEQLRDSYGQLQQRVRSLDLELDQKNQALETNLNEMEGVKNHLSHILSSLSAGVMVLDLEGRVTAFNPAAETITGRTRAQALEAGYRQVLQLDLQQRPTIPEFPCKARQEIRLRGREGEFRDVALSVSPLRGPRDEVRGTVVILEDVTTLKALEAQNEKSRRLAAMGEMAANIVHEIRNPLGGIELMASLLVEELSRDQESKELACQILAGVRSLHHILSNLSLFNRNLTTGRVRTDLNRLLEKTLKFTAELVHRQGVQVRRRFASPPPWALIDPELIHQVLLNLVINALQAMPSGGCIEIETESDLENPGAKRGFVQFAISDTGLGFTPEVQENMFSPFYTTKPRGTGLGLSIVRKIVSAHGGEVKAESRRGEGSRFTVRLPADEEQDACIGEDPPAAGIRIADKGEGEIN